MLTPHGVKVEEDFSDDYGGIDDHQDAESQLNWSTLEKADRATSTSAQTNTHIHTDVHESNYDNTTITMITHHHHSYSLPRPPAPPPPPLPLLSVCKTDKRTRNNQGRPSSPRQ